ncbi:hypothetical protein chiPu_0032390, partial [Chiloscyllium punctatum]|nr:hypothetical protein [Chiloscyllium punctatum]
HTPFRLTPPLSAGRADPGAEHRAPGAADLRGPEECEAQRHLAGAARQPGALRRLCERAVRAGLRLGPPLLAGGGRQQDHVGRRPGQGVGQPQGQHHPVAGGRLLDHLAAERQRVRGAVDTVLLPVAALQAPHHRCLPGLREGASVLLQRRRHVRHLHLHRHLPRETLPVLQSRRERWG